LSVKITKCIYFVSLKTSLKTTLIRALIRQVMMRGSLYW